jgi:hypothetical protein
MNVQDLIARLSELPSNTPVVISNYGNIEEIDEASIVTKTAYTSGSCGYIQETPRADLEEIQVLAILYFGS